MQKQIVAHRGAPKLARENTLESFQKAIDLGADMVELDVRQTLDGVLAVFHDAKIAGRPISQITFQELNDIAQKENFIVPTLAQAVGLLAGKVKASIEIKEMGYELKVAETAKQYLKIDEYEIISFIFPVLEKIGRNYPEVKLKLILGNRFGRLKQVLDFLFNMTKVLGIVNGFCLHYRLMDFGLHFFIPKNFSITVWTLDEPGRISKFLKNERVNFITTNYPDLALSLRNNL